MKRNEKVNVRLILLMIIRFKTKDLSVKEGDVACHRIRESVSLLEILHPDQNQNRC